MSQLTLPYNETHRTIALVDIDSLLRDCWQAWERADLAVLRTVAAMATEVDHVVCCFRPFVEQLSDGIRPRYSSVRHRATSAPLARSRGHGLFGHRDRKAEARATAASRLNALVERLGRLGLRCVSLPGYRSEDVIGTLAVRYRALCPDIRVVSPWDALQTLVSPSIRIFSARGRPRDIVDEAALLRRYACRPHQIPDWVCLDQALRGAIHERDTRAREVARILSSFGSARELLSQLQQDPDLAMSIVPAQIQLRSTPRQWISRLRMELDDWTLDLDVPVDALELLRRHQAEELTPEEQAAVRGELDLMPALRKNYEHQYATGRAEIERRWTHAQLVGAGAGFGVFTCFFDGRPAICIDSSTVSKLLPPDDRVTSISLRIFPSVAERDEHLEQLWRRGEM